MSNKIENIGALFIIVLIAMAQMVRATTRTDRLTNSCRWLGRAGFRPALLVSFSLMLSMSIALPFTPVASAATGDFSLDFIAANPQSYDHQIGGDV